VRRKQLGNSELKVSVVALGTWPMGGTTYGYVDDNESIATIRQAVDSGINLIDTAPGYGNGRAESVVGKAIKGRRDQVIIATKVGLVPTPQGVRRLLKPESIRREIEDSLRRLDVDTIDLYQIHWPDYTTPIEDSVAELIKLHEEGKYRYLGVSNFSIELMEKVQDMTNLVSLQPQYSLLNRDIEAEVLPYCIKNNIGILSYGSLGAGILAGKYHEKPNFAKDDTRYGFYPYFREPMWSKAMHLVAVLRNIAEENNKPVAHIAINWLTQQPGVTTALVGARHPHQAAENATAGSWQLRNEELALIDQTYQQIFD